MWSDEYKAFSIKKIILILICLIVFAGLLVTMLKVREKTEAEEALLQEQYDKQRIEQNAASQKAIDDIAAEYTKDLETVAQYLPGIVCWGDTLTVGSVGSSSYPAILQKCIDTYICDTYDFRSTIEDAEDYSRLKWNDYKIEVPVVNMGVADEDTNTILGRCGVAPYVLKKDAVIPAGTETVKIEIAGEDGDSVYPLVGGNGGVNNVVIDGIEGTLSVQSVSTYLDEKRRCTYYFSRLTEGEEHSVAKGTQIECSAAEMYKDYLHIVCIGSYGGYKTFNELVEQVQQLLARQTGNTDRYLVLGICYRESWCNMNELDILMSQAFGEHYINIRKYLCSDGMSDAGIVPSEDDEECARNGVVPKSLRSASDGAGLSSEAYKLIGRLVYERMSSLGYFDEINEELGIENSAKELLKENPNYFNDIVATW